MSLRFNRIEEEIQRGKERIDQLNDLEKKYADEAKKLESEASEFKNAGNKSKGYLLPKKLKK